MVVYPGGLALTLVGFAVHGGSNEKFWANIKWITAAIGIGALSYLGIVLVFYNTGLHSNQTLYEFFNPSEHAWLAMLTLFTIVCACWAKLTWEDVTPVEKPIRQHYRGKALLSFREAEEIAQRSRPQNDPGLSWGGLLLPSEAATTHFCVTGASGSGKTITIRLLMQCVLPSIGTGKDRRAIVYDAKQDVLSTIHSMKPKCPVITLNPFDQRSAAWDMAADITSPATAQQIATILISENKNSSQPFFSDAARHLLTGVLISLINSCPGKWTFRDVLLAMKSKTRLIQVISRTPETRDLLEYFHNEITAQNIMSTIQTKLQRYEFIAAAWEKAQTHISLKEWVIGEGILVLGNDEATRSALDAINQVIFKRLSELVLAQGENEARQTWVIFDEIREAGELPGLSSLLTKGRSKGACVVLGFQDMEGLRDVYGSKVANEIIGQCSNKAILRLESPETAQWASTVFGSNESVLVSWAKSFGSSSSLGHAGSSTNDTINQTFVKSENVLPSEFMNLPPTTRQKGLTGYYQTPYIGAFKVKLNSEWLQSKLLPLSSSEKNFIARPETDQYLRPWDKADFARLGLQTQNKAPDDETSEKQTDFGVEMQGEKEQTETPNILDGVGGGQLDSQVERIKLISVLTMITIMVIFV